MFSRPVNSDVLDDSDKYVLEDSGSDVLSDNDSDVLDDSDSDFLLDALREDIPEGGYDIHESSLALSWNPWAREHQGEV